MSALQHFESTSNIMTVSRDFRAAETPRDPILYLEVEAGDCPNALPRVLDLLTLQGLPPQSIAFERYPRGQYMLIGLKPFDGPRAERVLHKMRAIVSVAEARYVAGGTSSSPREAKIGSLDSVTAPSPIRASNGCRFETE